MQPAAHGARNQGRKHHPARQIQPDHRVGGLPDQILSLGSIVPIDHPAVDLQRRCKLGAEEIAVLLFPARHVVHRVELDPLQSQLLGQDPTQRGLAGSGSTDDVDPALVIRGHARAHMGI